MDHARLPGVSFPTRLACGARLSNELASSTSAAPSLMSLAALAFCRSGGASIETSTRARLEWSSRWRDLNVPTCWSVHPHSDCQRKQERKVDVRLAVVGWS